jgi:hypothetical protein
MEFVGDQATDEPRERVELIHPRTTVRVSKHITQSACHAASFSHLQKEGIRGFEIVTPQKSEKIMRSNGLAVDATKTDGDKAATAWPSVTE